MGNIGSVVKKIQKIGFEPIVVQKKEDLLLATKIILPGVGHFAKAMQNLKELDLLETLNKKVIKQKTPILGICLGMQIMAQHSEEGNAKGLGWFDADVVRFRINDKLKHKIPHMGWNHVETKKQPALFKNVDLEPGFYFVHAFHIQCNQTQDVLNTTTYEYPFTSAIQRDNIIGLQYHPEKSHDAGEQILLNFCENHF
jgi:glutamine amidotransferase